MEILFHNSNGYPSSKNNRHKVKEYRTAMEKKDITVILETGINK